MRFKLKLLTLLSMIIALSGSLVLATGPDDANAAALRNPCPNVGCIDGACKYSQGSTCLSNPDGTCTPGKAC